MNRTSLRQAIGPISFFAMLIACWFVAGLIADRMIRQELAAALRTEQQMSTSIVDNMAEVIASDLAMSRSIPGTMAEMGLIQHALTDSQNYAVSGTQKEAQLRADLVGRTDLAPVDNFLRDAQGFSGLDTVWLVNANGICIASSNADSTHSFIGRDMRTRNYIAQVLLGAFAENYGVGRETGEPGIFIAAPVYDDGMLVGAVVAKVGIARLRHWVAHAGSFVADDKGVVIMAHNSALEGRALPGAAVLKMSPAERMGTYRRSDFTVLQIRSAAQMAKREAPWVPAALSSQLVVTPRLDTPAMYQQRIGLNSGLSAHLVDPVAAWPDLLASHRRDHLLVFLTMAGVVGLACAIGVSWARERRHHRATRDLADQLTSANALLSAEARHDALTGALSRRYFLDLLKREIEHSRTSGEPLCMAIADLDHFKQINDRFGHAIGDRALEHFVESCRAELRASDAIGRLGGEEFGILLPATKLGAGHEAVERLRMRVKTLPSTKLPSSTGLSVSIGITELNADDALERLMSRADQALYAAKSAGRDRTEAVPPDDGAPTTRTAAALL